MILMIHVSHTFTATQEKGGKCSTSTPNLAFASILGQQASALTSVNVVSDVL